jgi:hypothetical protein
VSDTGATQLRGGPEFIWNTLEVSGPLEARADFLAAASGPGFIDWRPEWYSVYEQIYFAVMAAGAPSQQAARRVAGKLRDRFWREHETRRRAAELDQAHWGVTWPPRDVSFVMEHRRQGRALEPVGVFRFLTEDWSPWIAFAHMRARWPDLCFKVRPSYLEPVVPDGRARGVQENGRGKERRKARRASAGRRLPRQRHAELARELEAAL